MGDSVLASRLAILLISLAFGLAQPAAAAPLSAAELPAAAREWLPWAVQGLPEWGCPQAFDGSGSAKCVWPSQLRVMALASQGNFQMDVQVFGPPQRVVLPGEAGAWPQNVKADNKPVAVTEFEGQPAVWLPAGSHVLVGTWSWTQMPQNLRVPAGVGALVVGTEGTPQARSPDAEGRVWLRASSSPAEANDAVSVQTVRLINDDLPLTVTTAIELRVSGKARAIELPLALLPGSVAQALESQLPARLDRSTLIVQARPGTWRVQLQARFGGPLQALKLPESAGQGGGASEEVWLVQAQPTLRLIRPEGPASLDPRQAEMPEEWRQFPAFRMKPGDTLKLIELQRGNAQAAPDALTQQRSVWLDFDGGGWTVQDQFSGELKRSSRLALQPGGDLGRAAIDGTDQPVTRLAQGGPAGIEVRAGRARIEADSRWSAGGPLPANGWDLTVNSLRWALKLPPGWLLLHAQGPDRAEGAWTSDWTLWDFFFVLLAALAAARLAHWRLGLLLGLALTLTWHTPGSPPAVLWFALLAAAGLAQVVPAGRAATLLARFKLLAAGVLALCLLPFAVQQLRLTLYPSLEPAVQQGAPQAERAAAASISALHKKAAEEKVVVEEKRAPPPFIPPPEMVMPSPQAQAVAAEPSLDVLDPGARVQTGPGLPTWSWHEHHLAWSGPVLPEQTLRLWLLPPWAHGLFRLAGLALLALALAALMGWRPRGPKGSGLAGVAAGLLGLGLLAPPPAEAAPPSPPTPLAQAQAPWPDDAQLEALRQKLAAAPDCLPRCAELARLIVSATGSSVQLRAEVHAQAPVALPLLGPGGNWRPSMVAMDGQVAAARRDEDGKVWVAVPAGVHQVWITGDVGSASSVDISLPLPPREIQPDLKGWQLGGLDPRGQSTGALSLTREAGAATGKPEEAGTQRDALPPLVRIARTLRLGLRWDVLTRIERVAPSRAPLRVSWALLPGEAVSDARVKVEAGIASLQLGADDAVEVSANLPPTPTLTLKAGKEPNQVEQWTLAASTQWHAEASGLAPTALQQDGRWLPQWRPWPGESLKLVLHKPAGVNGQTLTLDSATTDVHPGERSTETRLGLKLRASLGSQQSLRLPAGAELLEVKLQGQVLPVQLREGQLSLPITPGEVEAAIRWREPTGMGLWWRHPGLELGLPGVNDHLVLSVPESRIVLAAGGPLIGPAVLFWGALGVVLALAWLAPRWLPGAPLPRSAWVLLALGVAPASLSALAVLALWFTALEARRRWVLGHPGRQPRWARILVQLGLVLLTLSAVGALLDVLRTGLLGLPDLLVAGPDSTAWQLSWIQDRFAEHTASAWVVSIPVWAYRAAMLLWALWLASALLKWVAWGWQAFSEGGVWPGPKARPSAPTDTPQP